MKGRIVGPVVLAVVGLGTALASQMVARAGQDHVTFCHATGSRSNPYVMISPSVSGAYHGHDLHHDGDIIPPFEYQGQTYSKNWDAEGRAIFENGCAIPKTPIPPQVTHVRPVPIVPNFTG
jgi:hypothetical protein